MTTIAATELALCSNAQCRQLSGCLWSLNGHDIQFASMLSPGEPSWRKGAEGIAFPLLDVATGTPKAYLKMFKQNVAQREIRAKHLIAEEWSHHPLLQAAPSAWIDTRIDGRPAGIDFDFCGYLSRAVLGRTWAEWKTLICEGEDFPHTERLRCASELLEACGQLEDRRAIHGDPSPGNIVIDLLASPGESMLQLCDFDSFVCYDEDGIVSMGLATGDGGACGTIGYSPPKIQQRFDDGESLLPESDRFGRDMLLFELLGFTAHNDSEASSIFWPESQRDKLQKRALARLSRCDRPFAKGLRGYLARPDVFLGHDEFRIDSKKLLEVS